MLPTGWLVMVASYFLSSLASYQFHQEPEEPGDLKPPMTHGTCLFLVSLVSFASGVFNLSLYMHVHLGLLQLL
jgi:hypothetical protein